MFIGAIAIAYALEISEAIAYRVVSGIGLQLHDRLINGKNDR